MVTGISFVVCISYYHETKGQASGTEILSGNIIQLKFNSTIRNRVYS